MTTSEGILPDGLTEDMRKKALTYAKLSSKTYDWDDNAVAKIGLAFFAGIGDVKEQDFATPDYIRKGRGGNFIDFLGGKESGLDYTIFQHKESGDIVLAFRGTEPLSITDWVTDIKQVLLGGDNEAQYTAALDLAKRLADLLPEGKNLSFTGHSLGGGLATAAALATGREAIVFCAAGLSSKTVETFDANAVAKAKVVNFNVRECFVSDYNYQRDDTTLGHSSVLGLDSKQYGKIYWLESVSDRADFIGLPDGLEVVKRAEQVLNHAWHVFTYQLQHKNFYVPDSERSAPELTDEGSSRPKKKARKGLVTPNLKK